MGNCKQLTYRVPVTDKHTSTEVQYGEPLSLLVCLRTMGGCSLPDIGLPQSCITPVCQPNINDGLLKAVSWNPLSVNFSLPICSSIHIFKSVNGSIANWWFNLSYFSGTFQGILLFIRIFLLFFRISYDIFNYIHLSTLDVLSSLNF